MTMALRAPVTARLTRRRRSSDRNPLDTNRGVSAATQASDIGSNHPLRREVNVTYVTFFGRRESENSGYEVIAGLSEKTASWLLGLDEVGTRHIAIRAT